jgi:uncharacterized protein
MTVSATFPVIDPLVNVANAWTAKVEATRRAESEVFRATADYSRDIPVDEMVKLLDETGVTKAIIGIDPENPLDWILDYVREQPGRFYLGAEPRLRHGLDALWAVEDLCESYPVVAVRVGPMFYGKPLVDPLYYPLFVKCIELDLPLCATTGIPGPPLLPADVQNPMYIDPILLEFPQLRFVMLHGADPWWDVAIRLLQRHRNLTMATSAWSPKRLPQQLIHYLRTRGRDKIMLASDFPILPIDRCIREAGELDLPPDVLAKYVHDNAERVFFGERRARRLVHAAL